MDLKITMNVRRDHRLFSIIEQLVFALLAITLTTMPLILLREHLSNSTVALIYLLPVTIVTTIKGLGAGLFTGLLAFLGFNFFFLEPFNTFKVHQTQDIIALLIFFLITVVISQLMGTAQKNLTQAKTREKELMRLYKLSTSLASVNHELQIAEVLANHILDAFTAHSIQILLVDENIHQQDIVLQIPIQSETPRSDPVAIIPLKTKRGDWGEIHMWRETPLEPELEEKLMENFATQGAAALERVALSRIETKTKVLEESDRMKSILLSSVSHELRTPLSTIKASVTSLLSEQVTWETEARKDLLTVMDEETDHLNRLVGNLLDMSRIESGALIPNRKWNLLSEIVDSVVTRMHRVLRNHQLEVDIPLDLPLVSMDFMQMEQVFSNLLSNSVKYSTPGSTIKIKANVENKNGIIVSLSNQGPQIAPQDLERIFNKFFRAAHTDKHSGTGLGLSICKGIINAHGGKIWVENLPDGVAFIFTLPLTWKGAQPPILKSEMI